MTVFGFYLLYKTDASVGNTYAFEMKRRQEGIEVVKTIFCQKEKSFNINNNLAGYNYVELVHLPHLAIS